MNRRVLITGADRGLGRALAAEYLKFGDIVFAGQYMAEWGELGALKEEYPERLFLVPLDVGNTKSVENACNEISKHTDYLDVIVNNAGISGVAGDIYKLEDLEKGKAIFNVNVIGCMRMMNFFLPFLQREESEKRLCFVSSEAGSISVCHRDDGFVYPMSKAALNMTVKMLFNKLNPEGYVFRLFHPGWVRSYMSGEKNEDGTFEPEESAVSAYQYFTSKQTNENILKLVDNEGRTWPF